MKSRTLYLKWRPSTFNEVVGQNAVVHTIQNAIAADKTVHAYLFSGPRGTGKTTVARILAKALNCVNDDLTIRPCDACEICKTVSSGRFLDLIEIDAASNNSVEDVRDLRDKINYSPGHGSYKVYIIDEVHMLSGAAFNALLKTLEEPPPHVVFVLATTELHKVPATVMSRCQSHTFRRISTNDVVGRLSEISEKENIEVEDDALHEIAKHSTGSLRDAVSLLDQVMMSEKNSVTLLGVQNIIGIASEDIVSDIVVALSKGYIDDGLILINDAVNDGVNPRELASQIVSFLRGVLLCSTGNDNLIDFSGEMISIMKECEGCLNTNQIVLMLKEFDNAVRDNLVVWHPQLSLEMAFVNSVQKSDIKVSVDRIDEIPKRDSDMLLENTSHQKDSEENNNTQSNGNLPNISDLKHSWKEIVSNSRKFHHTLPALLEWCSPVKIEDDTLQIGVKEEFAIVKLEQSEMISHIQNAIFSSTGHKFDIQLTLSDTDLDENYDGSVSDDSVVAIGIELGAKVKERSLGDNSEQIKK